MSLTVPDSTAIRRFWGGAVLIVCASLSLLNIWQHHLWIDEWSNVEKASNAAALWWADLPGLSDLLFVAPVRWAFVDTDMLRLCILAERTFSWAVWWLYLPSVILRNGDRFEPDPRSTLLLFLGSAGLAAYSTVARPTAIGLAGIFVLMLVRRKSNERLLGWVLAWCYPPALLTAVVWHYLEKRQIRVVISGLIAIAINIGVPRLASVPSDWFYLPDFEDSFRDLTTGRLFWLFNPVVLVLMPASIVGLLRVTHNSPRLKWIVAGAGVLALSLVSNSIAVLPRYLLPGLVAANLWMIVNYSSEKLVKITVIGGVLVYGALTWVSPNKLFESSELAPADKEAYLSIRQTHSRASTCIMDLEGGNAAFALIHLDRLLATGIWNPLNIGPSRIPQCSLTVPKAFSQFSTLKNRIPAYFSIYAAPPVVVSEEQIKIRGIPRGFTDFDFVPAANSH